MLDTALELETSPLHPSIGAAIHGLDLSRPLDSATVAAITDAWMEHIVLVFPNQPISDDALVAFGRQFGDLEIHPSLAHRASRNREIYRVSNLDEKGDFIPPENTAWQYVKPVLALAQRQFVPRGAEQRLDPARNRNHQSRRQHPLCQSLRCL